MHTRCVLVNWSNIRLNLYLKIYFFLLFFLTLLLKWHLFLDLWETFSVCDSKRPNVTQKRSSGSKYRGIITQIYTNNSLYVYLKHVCKSFYVFEPRLSNWFCSSSVWPTVLCTHWEASYILCSAVITMEFCGDTTFVFLQLMLNDLT